MLQNTYTLQIMCVYLCQQKQKKEQQLKNKHYDNNYENKARLN